MNERGLKGILSRLAFHWSGGPRGIGQTHLMMSGVDRASVNFPRGYVLLAHTKPWAFRLAGNRGIVIGELHKLEGCNLPLIADHFVMGNLMLASYQHIVKLEKDLIKAHNRIRELEGK